MLGNMYGGGYGGGYGQQGGSEMMIIALCCICCLCVASLLAGYWFNAFCGVGLGRQCKPKETPAPPAPIDTSRPTPNIQIDNCTTQYGGVSRSGADPRPPLRADYCNNSNRYRGRDCYYWKVEMDPATNQARWVRDVDQNNSNQDAWDAGCRSPVVNCPSKIDFSASTLPGYTDQNPGALISKCSAAPSKANTEGTTIKSITTAAKQVPIGMDGMQWTEANSKQWYNRVIRYVAQRDLAPLIDNTVKSASKVRTELQKDRLSKATYAYMLEASLLGNANSADWIWNITQLWVNSGRGRTEAGFIAHLQGVSNNKLQRWETVIDNPRFF